MRLTAETELPAVVGETLARLLEHRQPDAASVLALHGDLGAGKTTFMQHMARELGITEVVTSPTFVIMKRYELDEQVFEQLVHIDAYRVEDIDEMRPLGFAEIVAEKDTIVCIEWAENISALLPSHTVHLNIAIDGEAREFSLTNNSDGKKD